MMEIVDLYYILTNTCCAIKLHCTVNTDSRKGAHAICTVESLLHWLIKTHCFLSREGFSDCTLMVIKVATRCGKKAKLVESRSGWQEASTTFFEQTNFHLLEDLFQKEEADKWGRGIARYWGWMIPDGKKCKTGQNSRRARWRCRRIQTTRQLNFPDPNKVVRIDAKTGLQDHIFESKCNQMSNKWVL